MEDGPSTKEAREVHREEDGEMSKEQEALQVVHLLSGRDLDLYYVGRWMFAWKHHPYLAWRTLDTRGMLFCSVGASSPEELIMTAHRHEISIPTYARRSGLRKFMRKLLAAGFRALTPEQMGMRGPRE